MGCLAAHPGGDPLTAVVGLDLSIAATGIAWANGYLHTVDTARACTPDHRLGVILGSVRQVLSDGADLVVVEDLPTHARAAGITGMVHGVIRWYLIEQGIPYALVTPASLKKYATGRGNATKADMRLELFKRMDEDVRDDNQVDAWWLRAMGLDAVGEPLVAMPALNRVALEKITWPTPRRVA